MAEIETQWEDIPADVRGKILQIRDLLVMGDAAEAYHILYMIADPTCALLDPWRDVPPAKPFDPAEFGFEFRPGTAGDNYPPSIWRKNDLRIYRSEDDRCGIEYVDEDEGECEPPYGIYYGTWPDSAASARVILRHLGVEVG